MREKGEEGGGMKSRPKSATASMAYNRTAAATAAAVAPVTTAAAAAAAAAASAGMAVRLSCNTH
jgi:hypothetical protein